MDRRWAKKVFRQAMLKGHFDLTSGRHSDKYLEKAKIYMKPKIYKDLCWALAIEINKRKRLKVDVVVGPAQMGIVMAYQVADYLGEFYQEEVVPLFTEKDKDGPQVFRRDFAKEVSGKNVLVVDDILTTGKSVREVMDAVINAGGNVLGTAVFVNRGGVQPDDLYHLPIIYLVKMKMNDWPVEDCPLCKKGVSLINPKAR